MKTLNATQVGQIIHRSRHGVLRASREKRLPPPLNTGGRKFIWSAADIDLWLKTDCPNQDQFRKLKRSLAEQGVG